MHAGGRHDLVSDGEILRGAGEIGVRVVGDDARAFDRSAATVASSAADTISAAAWLCALARAVCYC
jgi:hypothetical protein